MKKLIALLLIVACLPLTVLGADGDAVDLDNGDYSLPLVTEQTQNLIRGQDVQYLVNGGFQGSFYSAKEQQAVMKLSMTGLAAETRVLVFLNSTPEERIFFSNAPAIGLAVTAPEILTEQVKEPEDITQADFQTYEVMVSLRQGINTIYIPPHTLTDPCGNEKYSTDTVVYNNKVCISSIVFVKDEADVMYASRHRIDVPEKPGYYSGLRDFQDMGLTGEKNQAIYNGSVNFDFTIEAEGTYALTLSYATNIRTEPTSVIGFLDPFTDKKYPSAAEYSQKKLQPGDGLPDYSEASFHGLFTHTGWGHTDPKVLATDAIDAPNMETHPANWTKQTILVKLKPGEHNVWIPYGAPVAGGGTIGDYYLYLSDPHRYNGVTSRANYNTYVYSLAIQPYRVDVPGKTVVYASDLEERNITPTTANGYKTRSYLNVGDRVDDPTGYTTRWENMLGGFVNFPFTVSQKGKYKVNVYYAMPQPNNEANKYGAAVMCLDSTAQLPDNANRAGVNRSDPEELAEYATYKAASTVIHEGDWEPCQVVWNGIDGLEDDKTNTQADYWKKAANFYVKSFDVDELKAGDHTAMFFIDQGVNDPNGNNAGTNRGVMFNRIEVVPVAEESGVDITTNVLCQPGPREVTFTGNDRNTMMYELAGDGNLSLMTVADARAALAYYKECYPENTNAMFQYRFQATFVNNTPTEKQFDVFLAQYDANGTLLAVETLNDSVVTIAGEGYDNQEYGWTADRLQSDTASMKMFIWENGGTLVPGSAVTLLSDQPVQVEELK